MVVQVLEERGIMKLYRRKIRLLNAETAFSLREDKRKLYEQSLFLVLLMETSWLDQKQG